MQNLIKFYNLDAFREKIIMTGFGNMKNLTMKCLPNGMCDQHRGGMLIFVSHALCVK